MSSLSELADKYNSDKGPHRDGSIGHNYVKIYEQYFLPLKDKNISILEIGVRTGASLYMWRDYFPNATIYGIDNVASYQSLQEERIRILIGDQGSCKEMSALISSIPVKPTLIIDDGSHKAQDIITSLHILKDFIAPNGYYFIEDMDPHQNKEMVKEYIAGLKDMKLLEYVNSEAGNKEELGVLQKL